MRKKFPDFKTDAEAEAFVATTDLSEYDLSDMTPVRFELRRKDKSVSLRLPEQLLEAVRLRAQRADMPTQRFIRMAIEQALQQPTTSKPER
jgi:predicted DNA binding CopG/RHH family protein